MRKIYRDRKSGSEGRDKTANSYRILFWGNEDILKLDNYTAL